MINIHRAIFLLKESRHCKHYNITVYKYKRQLYIYNTYIHTHININTNIKSN